MKKNLFFFLLVMIIGAFMLSGCGKKDDTIVQSPNKQVVKNNTTESSQENNQISETINNSFLYTANEGGSISKIDTLTNEVMETIKVDGTVHNVQVSPDGKMIGATVLPAMGHHSDHSSGMNGQAIFYNTVTNELMKEVEVGNHPAHIVFTEDGKYAVVTNNEDNTISIIYLKDFTIKQTIATGKGPHGFRISTDNKFAFVANMSEDTVSVINLDSFSEEKKIRVGSTPVTTGVTTDGKTLLATLHSENAISVVDLASGEIKKVKVGKGPAQVYIQSDNQFAFIANQGSEDAPSNTVTKIDLETKVVVATIETGKGAHGVVTSPDNKYVYVTNMYDNTVTVIDNILNKVIETIEVGKVPNGISVMPK